MIFQKFQRTNQNSQNCHTQNQKRRRILSVLRDSANTKILQNNPEFHKTECTTPSMVFIKYSKGNTVSVHSQKVVGLSPNQQHEIPQNTLSKSLPSTGLKHAIKMRIFCLGSLESLLSTRKHLNVVYSVKR